MSADLSSIGAELTRFFKLGMETFVFKTRDMAQMMAYAAGESLVGPFAVTAEAFRQCKKGLAEGRGKTSTSAAADEIVPDYWEMNGKSYQTNVREQNASVDRAIRHSTAPRNSRE